MQNISWRFRPLAGVGLFLTLLALSGCKDKIAEQVGEMNKTNLRRVTNMYEAFQNMKGGRGPKDKEELSKFIQEFDPSKLKMMGIELGAMDNLFTSERDGKPFVIRYNVGGGRGSVAPVVFEQDGKDGKKQVGFTGGKVEEVDDAQYKLYLSGKGGTASGGGPPGGGGRPGSGGPPPGAPTGPTGK